MKYLNKISGPLLDRIDLHVQVTPVPFAELSMAKAEKPSAVIRERVVKARVIQSERFVGNDLVYCNAQMGSKLLKEICALRPEAQNLIRMAMDKLNLSARAYDRILKVARTIADLDGRGEIQTEHVAEAIQYRSLDRGNWGL